MLNLTPHAIVLRSSDGYIVIQPSGQVARVAMAEQAVDGLVFGLPVVRRQAGAVTGLIVGETGVIAPCLVSGMVLDALSNRPELSGVVFAPDSGATAIRENGQIVAVTRLVTI